MKKIAGVFVFCFLFPVFVLGGSFTEDARQSQKKAMEWFVRQYILARFEIGSDTEKVESKFAPDGLIARMSSKKVYDNFKIFYKYNIKERNATTKVRIDSLDTQDNFKWNADVILKVTAGGTEEIVPLKLDMQIQCDPLGREFDEENPFGCKVVYFDGQEENSVPVQNAATDKFDSEKNVASLKPKNCGPHAFYSEAIVCAFCLDEAAIPATADECTKCPNRKIRGRFCVLNDESPKKAEEKISNGGVSDNASKREVKIQNRVVFNDDAKGALPVCGSVASTQSCLFYMLNIRNHAIVAEDFFDQVAHAMNRRVRSIRSENPSYQKQVIKPGYFAEIVVPPMK